MHHIDCNCHNFFFKSLKVEFQASTDAMIIDVDTAKHVELLSSSMSKKKESSLYGVLNKCSTPGGSKLLRATLFQPPIKVNSLFFTFDFRGHTLIMLAHKGT